MVSAQLSCNKFLTSWLLFSASAQAAGAHAFNFLNTTAPTSTKLSTTLSFATESETTSATTSTTTSEIAQAYKTDYPLPSGYVAKPPTSFTNNQVPPQQMNHGNPNPIILSLNESVDLAIMEANFYTYFAQNAPVPGTPRVQLPEVVCDTVSRLSRRKTSCETFKSFSFNVYFHYIWTPESTVNHLSRDLWEERIKLQMDFLKAVYEPVGIFPVYAPLIHEAKSEKFTNNVIENSDFNKDIIAQLRKGRFSDLNVFLVDSITSTEISDLHINGYTRVFTSKDSPSDGIVMDQARLGNEQRNTLVHEMGHWLGLEHTFGDIGSVCTIDDGLLDTSRTSGSTTVVQECDQVPCVGGAPTRIVNWMSLSKCQGQNEDGSITENGFTTDQKARMFARYLRYRAGIDDACNKDPGVTRRDDIHYIFARQSAAAINSLKNVHDGTCPKPGDPIPGTTHAAGSGPTDLNKGNTGSKAITSVASEDEAPTSTVSGVAGATSAVPVEATQTTGSSSAGSTATQRPATSSSSNIKVSLTTAVALQALLSVFYTLY